MMSGNALKSHLYTYLILPEDDDLHMPPTGKRQLTRMEIKLIEHHFQYILRYNSILTTLNPQ
jgi:hypothetical protein